VAGTSLNGAAEDSNLLGCDTVTVRVVVDVSKGLSASIFMVLPQTLLTGDKGKGRREE
jgi:hypothetical protein